MDYAKILLEANEAGVKAFNECIPHPVRFDLVLIEGKVNCFCNKPKK